MLSRAFVHDANQCLHVIRLAAESLSLDDTDGRLTPERLRKRIDTILDQVDHLTALIGGAATPPSPVLPQQPERLDNPSAPQILLVDDEVLAALMLADHLQQRGYGVDVAHDGQEAFDLCHQHVYDAVVTDIRMPRMDGMDLIRHLHDLQPGTPVIVASGHVRSGHAEDFPDSVAQVIGKPFSPTQISEALAKLAILPGAGQ
ncbi:MAG: Response regulator [Rhodospirillaceae bacterium]|nr:MAG: Response regulator [Rhodospirillaceae bacterium]TNC97121.1 MAG: Response regulator receiver [Stygiobacter sp.]